MRMPITLLLLLPVVAGAQSTLLDEIASAMEGRYDTHAPGIETTVAPTDRLVDSRQRVDAPSLGAAVFYLQLNTGEDLKLYRQRILVLAETDAGVVQTAFTLREPEKYVDARSGDRVLSNVTVDDIEPMFETGCGQHWEPREQGYYGHTDPKTCRIISSRTGKPRRIEGETLLDGNRLELAERGFDDEMNQLFGSPIGERTTLYRVEGH